MQGLLFPRLLPQFVYRTAFAVQTSLIELAAKAEAELAQTHADVAGQVITHVERERRHKAIAESHRIDLVNRIGKQLDVARNETSDARDALRKTIRTVEGSLSALEVARATALAAHIDSGRASDERRAKFVADARARKRGELIAATMLAADGSAELRDWAERALGESAFAPEKRDDVAKLETSFAIVAEQFQLVNEFLAHVADKGAPPPLDAYRLISESNNVDRVQRDERALELGVIVPPTASIGTSSVPNVDGTRTAIAPAATMSSTDGSAFILRANTQ